MPMRAALILTGLCAALAAGPACMRTAAADAPAPREYHVSPQGDDAGDGSPARMLKTISAAARLARPGDVITVHAGVYRERINPPRGGTSDAQRITYRAAPGEKVVLKGSEVVKGWQKVQNDTWKVVLPNTFFGDFNPFGDRIHGDWFNPKGRVHHTGAVYLDGHWLTEAAQRDDVLKPAGKAPLWFAAADGRDGYLLNVAWLRPAGAADEAARIPADAFAAQQGVQAAACSEGGKCIGWIEAGDWVRYDKVDFGQGTGEVEIRAASPGEGGRIELRLDRPDGELLGTCSVTATGDWQKWATFRATIQRTSGTRTLCLRFMPHGTDDANTTIWAQFKGVDPNEAEVEVNVRQSVFYPDRPGVNYLTVRGFTMLHAATPWAPPTAEQIGLVGTHWSKGWIIEDNDIRYSTCVGVTLGKYGDEWDNRSQSADAYNRTIRLALENGWSRENIGHHVVRHNRIAHCEQAGLVGSLGAAFSTITGNVIHDIHVRRLFSGAEMAGIKIHAAIDTRIAGNHIYRTTRGIWLDWMAQGTRVTGNLLHDNDGSQDLFVEVDHGPFLIDNNIFLSPGSLLDMSEGGAYVHNLFAGRIVLRPELRRETPFHKPHSTEVAGLRNIRGGDDRFYNNLFVGPAGLAAYDKAAQPVAMAGNVFLKGAQPSRHKKAPLVQAEFDPGIELLQTPDGVTLRMTFDKAWADKQPYPLVTTDLLGRAAVPDLPYEQPDGTPYRLDIDYVGRKRDAGNPFPGPFERPGDGRQAIPVRPVPVPE